jgi:hypothetical protein
MSPTVAIVTLFLQEFFEKTGRPTYWRKQIQHGNVGCLRRDGAQIQWGKDFLSGKVLFTAIHSRFEDNLPDDPKHYRTNRARGRRWTDEVEM